MAAKKKSTGKGRVKVNKLKVKKEKVEELTDKEKKRIRGGQSSGSNPWGSDIHPHSWSQ